MVRGGGGGAEGSCIDLSVAYQVIRSNVEHAAQFNPFPETPESYRGKANILPTVIVRLFVVKRGLKMNTQAIVMHEMVP